MMLHLSLYIETDNHDSSHRTSHMQCYIDKVLLYCVTAHIVHCNYLQRKEFQRRLFQKIWLHCYPILCVSQKN